MSDDIGNSDFNVDSACQLSEYATSPQYCVLLKGQRYGNLGKLCTCTKIGMIDLILISSL